MSLYRSPFRLLQLSPATCTVQVLQLTRKQLLAEFELQQRDTIEWNGTTLDRQQAIDLVEELLQPDRFLFHKQVYEHPLLLSLLEEADPQLLFRQETGIDDPVFIVQCESYLIESFGTIAVEAFARADSALLLALNSTHPLLTVFVRQRLWEKLRISLQQQVLHLQQLKKILQFQPVAGKEQLDQLTQLVQRGCVLALPDALYRERERLVSTITDLLWLVPDSLLSRAAKQELLQALSAIAQEERTREELKYFSNWLRDTGLESLAVSRMSGVLMVVPLLLLLGWIVLTRLNGNFSGLREQDKQTLFLAATIFFWVYTLSIVGYALRHVFTKFHRARLPWTLVLLFVNVIMLPIYWGFFIRNPKDRAATGIALVMLLLVLGMALWANSLGKP